MLPPNNLIIFKGKTKSLNQKVAMTEENFN